MSNITRVFSFGGGVQSVAVLALQALGVIEPYDEFIFANVGDHAESPKTLKYLVDYALPFALDHGITVTTVQKKNRKGEIVDLFDYTISENNAIPLPVMLSGGNFGARACTSEFKIRVIDKHLKAKKQERIIVGLGISVDEFQRMKDTDWHDRHGKTKFGFWKALEYPLIDQRLSRSDCATIIKSVGLPVPPKSSCFFCPFHTSYTWQILASEDPQTFKRACDLENRINEKRAANGKESVYLHQAKKGQLRPLEQQVSVKQALMFDDTHFDECESGYCHT